MFSLTSEQRAVVACDAHALEVRAGAGCGKTTTLAHRVARFGPDLRAQSRLLVVTFTREATSQLQRRLSLLLGRDHGVRVTSFHQWAARELPPEERRFLADDLGRRFVADAIKRRGVPPGFARAVGAVGEDADVAARVLSVVSHAKNAATGLCAGPFGALAPWEDFLEGLRDEYESRKGDRLDFDDLLVTFRDRLARSSGFRKDVRERLDHVFVDEYQDVNVAQADAVRLIASGKGAPRVTVVGDPRQSIYGFRGGSPAHMDRFLATHGRSGKRLALSTNFRATRALVASANAALPDAFPLKAPRGAGAGASPDTVPCEDGAEEGHVAADRVEGLLARGVDPAEIVVLARSRHLARGWLDEVTARLADEAWAGGDVMGSAVESFLSFAKNRTVTPALLTAFVDAPHANSRAARAARILERRARVAGLKGRPTAASLLALPTGDGLERVTFSTIHAAKGLEWDHVILLGAHEGGLPGAQALNAPEAATRDELVAEERRLLYVALTRARRSVTVTWSRRMGRRDTTLCRWLAQPIAANGVEALATEVPASA